MLRARHALVALPFLACDSQTDSDYRGEVLAELRGVVTVPAALEPPDAMEIIVLWDFDNGDGDEFLGQSAEVRGEFPARFALSITEPPPDIVLGEADPLGRRGAIGYVAAIPKGKKVADVLEGNALPAALSGRYVVVYSEQDVPADTLSALQLGGPLKAGYHLLEAVPYEEWSVEHPEAPDCEFFDSGCDWESDEPSASEWQAYEACEYAARIASNCIFPEYERAMLRPAADGFATDIELVLTDDADVLDDQGPDLH